MAMVRDVSKLSRLLLQLAVKKMSVANKRTITCLMKPVEQRRQELIQQSRRSTQQEKLARDRKHIRDVQKKRIEEKDKIPHLSIPSCITVGELSVISDRTPEDIYYIKSIVENVRFRRRKTYPLNETLSGSVLTKTVKKLGYRPVLAKEEVLKIREDMDIYSLPVTTDSSKLLPRPPIVAVMGHVDHGKTTILDALRNTSVAAGEAGGITQSIGAFSVPLATDQAVTFIDTPGHSVFTSMRERGAKVTDIIVLVVAADDGVMEQTVESINMAKMAEATIVVALNKCDKKDSDPDLVIEDLDNHGIKCEEIGGSIPAVRISALKNVGLDKLVQTIFTRAKELNLTYDPNMQVQGFVLESKTERGRGNMVSVIVKQGTLEVGKFLVAGTSMAKVKMLLDANGERIKSVRAGEAAHIMGWRSLPGAGQMVLEAESEQKIKAAVKQREKEMDFLKSDDIWKEIEEKRTIERDEYNHIRKNYPTKLKKRTQSYILALKKNKLDDSIPHLNIIMKADVDGSMEAIMKILESYNCDDDCHLNLVSSGVGELKLSEYELAEQLGATVFLYNTNASAEAVKRGLDHVKISQHKVIYHLVNDLIEKINETLPPADKNIYKGEAEVLQLFKKGRQQIAGCKVLSGTLEANEMHAIVRDGSIVHQGPLLSLREKATTISKVTAGNECGLTFADACESGIEVGDRIQCYMVVKEDRKINWRPPGF